MGICETLVGAFLSLGSIWCSAMSFTPFHAIPFAPGAQRLVAEQQPLYCASNVVHQWSQGFFSLLQLDFNKGKLEKILRSSSTAPWYYRQPLFVIPYVNWSSPLKPVIFLWPSEKAAVYLFISFFLNTALTLPSFCYSQRLSSLLQQRQQNLRKSSTKCTKK